MTISGTPSRAISTGMGVPQLVWRKPPPHAGVPSHLPQLRARRGDRPWPSMGRTVDDAEQRSGRQLDTRLQPRVELRPGPIVHADLAAPRSLPAPDEQRSATPIEVAFGERERLMDPQASAPQDGDQAARPATVDAVAGTAHYRDDLLDRRRVGRIAHPLVARRAASMEGRQRRR
jgi:hypothetical protein